MRESDGGQGPAPFSGAWAKVLQNELNSSEAFRQAAAGWQGRLVLETVAVVGSGKDAGHAVALYLADGACREARPAVAADRETAAFVIAGTGEVWSRMLTGESSPLTALLRGHLKLVKGSVAGLMPFAPAAEQLVQAAGRIAASPAPGPEAAASEPPVETSFRSMRPDGIDFDSLPMQLWQKAKQLGIWDPRAIDYTTDRRDWLRLDELERDVLLRLAALFGAGEESVTRELLPLIRVIARQGRLEEEMFLAAFLWEEAKHVEAFRLFFDEVAADTSDLSRFHTPSYRRIFCDELPAAMGRLDTDSSPIALARASATYNMIVEGVLAETGYHVYHSILARRAILPGMLQVVGHLQQDESRHLAYGVHLLSRLVAEHGESVWRAVESRMDELLQPAVAIIQEVFEQYEKPPFGLEAPVFVDFAVEQFGKRLARIERARRQ
jgi:ribonucleoside-diphosphate reductase beta chain